MKHRITRRRWLSQSTATGAAMWLTSGSSQASSDEPPADDYHVYFGDLHNHNEVGYARGSLQRTFEIARNHFDFFAFTPHGYWHDIGHYENNIENKWLNGFDVTRDRWPEVLATVRRFHQPGTFVAIAGYECHSTSLGDYHVIFPDDHLGYPGGYREGLAAVFATGLTREAIFDALRHRRCYAVSGDRIRLDFRLNGHRMGSELPYAAQRELAVDVTGWDQVDRVEILKNNRVLDRDFPMDRVPTAASWDQPVLLRFEYGWGPWPALDMTRVCDWNVEITLDGGVLEDVQTCFQSGPLEEDRRDRIVQRSPRLLHLESFTALRQQFEDYSQKAVVLKVRGGPDSRVTVKLNRPTQVSLSQTFRQLAESNEMLFSGDFPKESAMLHRLVFDDHYHTRYTVTDEDDGKGVTWYYVRVVQANEQYAWSSPICVEPRGVV